MCRLLVYAGEPMLLHDLLYGPEHSIVKQASAAHDEEDRVNADGFGVAWYAPEVSPLPGVMRSVRPIWSHASLRSVCQLVRSGLVFAHVRAASEGLEVTETNCHPFCAAGFLWMHNGTVGSHARFRDWARRFLSPAVAAHVRGTTDSEHLFGLFLELWGEASGADPTGRIVTVLSRTIKFLEDFERESGVREPTTLNIAVTDGRSVVAVRHALRHAKPPLSLFHAEGVRPCRTPRGLSFVRAPEAGGSLIASEPLTPDGIWQEAPAGSLLVLGPERRVEHVPL